jgi:hypothetical protein
MLKIISHIDWPLGRTLPDPKQMRDGRRLRAHSGRSYYRKAVTQNVQRQGRPESAGRGLKGVRKIWNLNQN